MPYSCPFTHANGPPVRRSPAGSNARTIVSPGNTHASTAPSASTSPAQISLSVTTSGRWARMTAAATSIARLV